MRTLPALDCMLPHGDRHAGGYIDGLSHGTGTFTSPVGRVRTYVGQFKAGERVRMGTFDYGDGTVSSLLCVCVLLSLARFTT